MSQLRDIEILTQQQVEVLEADGKDDETLREIQKILYSTEVRSRLLFVLVNAELFSGGVRGAGSRERGDR
jgi:hypothetical protein